MEELEPLCRQVWGAYEYLRDNDISESGTSRRLRVGNAAPILSRLQEEIAELRGVVEGTHIHEGFDQDIILEGYEVWYWAVSLAVTSRIDYKWLRPHQGFWAGFTAVPIERTALLPIFDKVSQKMFRPMDCDDELESLAEVFWLVGRACSLNGTSPTRLLERDRDEMLQKTYLAAYWGKSGK